HSDRGGRRPRERLSPALVMTSAAAERPQTASPLLSVRGLTKIFTVRQGLKTRHVHALSDVWFDVDRGEVVALVGESGSGKSTAARLIARLIPPTRGQILLGGRDVLATRRPSIEFRSQ